MKGSTVAAGIAAGAGLAAWSLFRKKEEYDLLGKVVLITGGSRGLGLEIAREFGAQKARVVICARERDELDRARQDLEQRGIAVHAIECDITRRDEIYRMIAEAEARMGPIDILVNNAGVIQVGPIDQMTIADFENAMSIIFWGTVNTTLALLPKMKHRRQGRIVNITSIGGKVSVPHLVPYSCAKFATVAFSEGLRAECLSYGIKVVTIVPGLMRTGSHLQAEFKGRHPREYAWFALGAASPFVSISAERAARSVVDATKRGEAERILSVPAQLLARVHGALPELTAEMTAAANWLLPASPENTTGLRKGYMVAQQVGSKWFEILTQQGQGAAQNLNETPAT